MASNFPFGHLCHFHCTSYDFLKRSINKVICTCGCIIKLSFGWSTIWGKISRQIVLIFFSRCDAGFSGALCDVPTIPPALIVAIAAVVLLVIFLALILFYMCFRTLLSAKPVATKTFGDYIDPMYSQQR